VSSFQYGMSVPMATTGRLPILRMGNIQNGSILLDDLKYVSLPDAVIAPYRLHRGDVLFNRTNSQQWVGKVGIYRSDSEAVFASYLIRLVHDTGRIDPYYLGHVLGAYQAQSRIKRYATPGVQQVNINARNLGKVLIPVPPGDDGLEEQREIARILEDVQMLVTAYEPLLQAQRTLKRALTQDLLSGRVRLSAESTAFVAS
jgi:type I restriction enzyme S subunit